MAYQKLEFINFCILALAEKLGKSVSDTYMILTKETNLEEEYLEPRYDVLHRKGKEYIVGELIQALNDKGITV